MNHIYRVVFNRVTGCWQAVTELAKSSSKVGGSVKRNTHRHVKGNAAKLAALAALAAGAGGMAGQASAQNAPAANQHPQGGNVAAGQASINNAGNVMNIDQATQKAIINWQEFNVGADARVNFNQPGADSVTLNRVLSQNPSQIFGQIVAPGQVILINPNGAYFAPSASVDVGGLIATTHELADKDFLDGNYEFKRNGATGKIINDGELKAKLDGYIALMAPEVRNQGVIVAERGTVVLAAGEHIQLDFGTGNKLQGITVTEQDLDAQIANKHAIIAEGGLVILSARATAELRASVIKNSGQIVASAGANTVTQKGGRIILEGNTIEVTEGSELMATGPKGGGEVLIGGDWQGGANEERRVFDDPDAVHEATTVMVQANTTIDASATDDGDGGTVVVWSDVKNPDSVTRIYGELLAEGGEAGGDGGQIETSGFYLDVKPSNVSASAANGERGEWLLDPYNIVISSSTDGTSFSSSGADYTYTPLVNSTILASSIVSALNAGTNVTVSTGLDGSAGDSVGDITVNTAINATTADGGDLTLEAARDIVLNANLTIAGAMTFNGDVRLGADTTLTAAGVTFGNTLNSDDITPRALTISGNLSFAGSVGRVKPLRSLSVSGTTQLNGGDVQTTGAQTYNDAVTLGTNTTLYVIGLTAGDMALGGYNFRIVERGRDSSAGSISGTISGTNNFQKSGSGTLTLSGSNNYTGSILVGAGVLVITNTNTYTRAITIQAAGVLVIANDTPTTASSGFDGSGQLRIEPGLNSSSFTSDFTNTGWTIANTLTGLTIGRASNTADVTFTSPIAINGPMTLYGGDITVAGSSTDLTLQAAGQVVFDGMTVTGNLLSTTGGAGGLGGVSQTGALQVTGTSIFTADGGTAQMALLNEPTNNFVGAVSFVTANGGSWQDVTLVDGTGGLVLGDVDATGAFTVTSTAGAITQLSGTQLVIGGDSTFTASNGASPNPTLYDITLDSATNDFGGVVNATGDNIELDDGTDGIELGNTNASGTLAVTSTDGALTQEQGSSITVTGVTTLTATNGTAVFDITLGEGSNDFGQGINARGDSITLVDGTGGLVLGDINAAGAFTATSAAGAITQLSGTQLVIGGESTLTASNGAASTPTLYDITLDRATNDFGGVVNATGANIELEDGTDGMALGNIDASGTLAVTSTGGAVTQEQGSAITVTGVTTLTATNGTDVFDITLGEGSNDFGTGINARGDSITLVDGTGGLVFGDIDAAGALTATSTDGAITQDDSVATDGTSSVVVGGNTDMTATNGGQFADVVLDGTTNDFVGTVDVSGSTVTLRDANALSLGGINASGSISAFGADVTLAAASTAGANSDIVVSATDNFFNTQGADALNVSGTGRWVVYIGNARGNDYGNLDSQNEAVWNESYNTMAPGAVPSGNRYVFDQDAIRRVVVESTDATKVYGETIDLNNNYTLVATGVSGVEGAYLSTNTSSTVTAGQVFSTNPTFAATGEVATAGVGESTIISTPGTTTTLFDVVYQDLGELTVTARPIELTATADTKTYGDADPTLVYTIEAGSAGRGLANSDVFTGTADRASGENVGNYAIGQGTVDNANYAITWTSNDLTIAPRAITLAADAVSKIYGDVDPTLSVSVVNGSLGSQTVNDTIDDLTGTLSRAAGSDVGRYDVLLGTGSRAGNYTVTFDAANEALAITPRPITLTADTATKVYGENDPALTYGIEALGVSRGLVGNDTFSGSVTRLAGEDVGNYAIGQGTVDNANYAITWTSNDLSITPRAITLQADAASKVYGDVDPTLSVSIVGGSVATAMGETLADVTGTVGRTGDDNAGVYDVVLGTGNKAQNYAITFEANNNAFEIERARLIAAGTKVYDGSILFSGQGMTILGVNGETFASVGDATMGTKNVQSNQQLASLEGFAVSQTGNGVLSNYESLALSDTAVTVTVRPVMLSATQAIKTYDGTLLYEMSAADLTSLSASLVGGDSVVGADLMFDSKDVSRDGSGNVLSNRNVTLSNVQIDDGNVGGNYQVTIIDATDGRINPAPLTVRAVNDAKFVTQADPNGYLGVVYTGFVGGETEATSGLQVGQLTRSNAAQNAAGKYTDVLVAGTAWRANNYEITFENGDFTIVPADTLLVRAPALDTTYGEALPEFTTVTAQYLDSSDNQIKTLAVNYNNNTNLYSTTDGVGSNATFGFAIDNAPLSTAGFAQAGGYNVAPDTNTTFSGNNFQDLVMVGSLTVAPKTLANNLGINEVTKVYDGNRSIAGLDLNFDGMTAGVISGDLVSLVGNGAYADRNVGTDKAVNLSLALRGEDANNYRLTTPTYSANVGTISQRESVTWVGADGGNWSDSRNWQDGALPDGNNVANVLILDGAEVFYNSDLVGVTTSTIANNGTIQFASNNAFTLMNTISGSGSIEQRGTGLLTLAGNSTFTGATDIGNYSLRVAANNALGAGNLVSNGGRLTINDGVTLAGLTVTGAITLQSNVISSGAQTYGGPITLASGSLQSPLTIRSSGDVTLNGTVSAGVGAKGAQRSLSLDGNRVTIADQIGMPVKDMLYGSYQGRVDTNPYALTVTGNEIYLLADVTTFEEQRYVGPVFIGDNGTNGFTRTLISVDPSVTFTNTVDAVIDGLHGLDVRAYSMAMNLNETPTITFADAVGQIRALAGLYVDVGLQNQSPTALVATPAPNLPPTIGRVTLGGNVTTAGGQTYRGNSVVLGNGQSGQTITLTANTGTVDIIVGEGANAGLTGIERLRLAFGEFTVIGDGLGNLLRTANIDFNQILIRTNSDGDAISSSQGSTSGTTQSRLESLLVAQQNAGVYLSSSEQALAEQQQYGALNLELDAHKSSSVLILGEVEVGEIDSLGCAENEMLREGECVAAGG